MGIVVKIEVRGYSVLVLFDSGNAYEYLYAPAPHQLIAPPTLVMTNALKATHLDGGPYCYTNPKHKLMRVGDAGPLTEIDVSEIQLNYRHGGYSLAYFSDCEPQKLFFHFSDGSKKKCSFPSEIKQFSNTESSVYVLLANGAVWIVESENTGHILFSKVVEANALMLPSEPNSVHFVTLLRDSLFFQENQEVGGFTNTLPLQTLGLSSAGVECMSMIGCTIMLLYKNYMCIIALSPSEHLISQPDHAVDIDGLAIRVKSLTMPSLPPETKISVGQGHIFGVKPNGNLFILLHEMAMMSSGGVILLELINRHTRFWYPSDEEFETCEEPSAAKAAMILSLGFINKYSPCICNGVDDLLCDVLSFAHEDERLFGGHLLDVLALQKGNGRHNPRFNFDENLFPFGPAFEDSNHIFPESSSSSSSSHSSTQSEGDTTQSQTDNPDVKDDEGSSLLKELRVDQLLLARLHSTLGYYNDNADKFAATTTQPKLCLYEILNKHIKSGSMILDFGCGCGRDIAYFFSQHHTVVGLDASEQMVRLAKENVPTCDVVLSIFQAQAFRPKVFDVVWAQASLIHVPYEQTAKVFKTVYEVLTPGGLFYAAYKRGEGSFCEEGRWFYRMSEDKLKEYLAPHFNIVEMWTREDHSKVSSSDAQWVCFIAQSNPQSKIDSAIAALPIGLKTEDVQGDGNCFFYAVEKQLQKFSSTNTSPMNCAELRKFAVNYVASHRDSFKDFIHDETPEHYIDRIERDRQWADHVLIKALVLELQINIVIFESDVLGALKTPIIITPDDTVFERTIFLYHIPELHYQSIGSIESISLKNVVGILREGGIEIPGFLLAPVDTVGMTSISESLAFSTSSVSEASSASSSSSSSIQRTAYCLTKVRYDNPILAYNYHKAGKLFETAKEIGGSQLALLLMGVGENKGLATQVISVIEDEGAETFLRILAESIKQQKERQDFEKALNIASNVQMGEESDVGFYTIIKHLAEDIASSWSMASWAPNLLKAIEEWLSWDRDETDANIAKTCQLLDIATLLNGCPTMSLPYGGPDPNDPDDGSGPGGYGGGRGEHNNEGDSSGGFNADAGNSTTTAGNVQEEAHMLT